MGSSLLQGTGIVKNGADGQDRSAGRCAAQALP
jgi:hypothetical protein